MNAETLRLHEAWPIRLMGIPLIVLGALELLGPPGSPMAWASAAVLLTCGVAMVFSAWRPAVQLAPDGVRRRRSLLLCFSLGPATPWEEISGWLVFEKRLALACADGLAFLPLGGISAADRRRLVEVLRKRLGEPSAEIEERDFDRERFERGMRAATYGLVAIAVLFLALRLMVALA